MKLFEVKLTVVTDDEWSESDLDEWCDRAGDKVEPYVVSMEDVLKSLERPEGTTIAIDFDW